MSRIWDLWATTSRTTYNKYQYHLVTCLQELHKQIVDDHNVCCVNVTLAAHESATSSSSTADACLASATSNIMELMMRLSNVKARAVAPTRSQSKSSRQSLGRSGERGSGFGASDEKTTD